MKILERLALAEQHPGEHRPPVIAFLGDSVTHGVFEIRDGFTFDFENVYHAQLRRMLAAVYPRAAVNIINAGVTGVGAPHGLARLERDVLSHAPDLTVVCFGLNDVHGGEEGMTRYTDALRGIFVRLREAGSEIIFLTPNMMNTRIAPQTAPEFMDAARACMKWQTSGMMDRYMDAARAVCRDMGVPVCDCYARWKAMHAAGADVMALLSNDINHPTRALHGMFAAALMDVMLTM